MATFLAGEMQRLNADVLASEATVSLLVEGEQRLSGIWYFMARRADDVASCRPTINVIARTLAPHPHDFEGAKLFADLWILQLCAASGTEWIATDDFSHCFPHDWGRDPKRIVRLVVVRQHTPSHLHARRGS